MYTVELEDGTEVTLPKPEGQGVAQLSIRTMYLNMRIMDAKPELVDDFIDDIIYLLLDYWKSKEVPEPFKRLTDIVMQEKMSFDNIMFQELFYKRVFENATLVSDFKSGDGQKKKLAQARLKERGFIGKRKINQYDKTFLRKAGIDV